MYLSFSVAILYFVSFQYANCVVWCIYKGNSFDSRGQYMPSLYLTKKCMLQLYMVHRKVIKEITTENQIIILPHNHELKLE